jgi:hypothetical protein
MPNTVRPVLYHGDQFYWWRTPECQEKTTSWSYGSWIYNYLCNQYLSPLKLWVWIPLRRGVLDTTLCDTVCQWHATGRWSSPGTPASSTTKTGRHDIAEILLKVALNTINQISKWKWTFIHVSTNQVTCKLYHLWLRVECTLSVIYKSWREPTPYW